MKGRHHSEESKAKIRLGNLGKKRSVETRKRISEGHMGIKPSEETRRKLSKIRKGRKITNETKEKIRKNHANFAGSNHPLWGKHHSEATKIKMSESQRGEKGSNWKGGLSFEPYGVEFNKRLKELIRARDGFTCQKCGEVENGKAFPVHHIDYDKKNSDPMNLITLCVSCNVIANGNRKYWQGFFINRSMSLSNQTFT